MGFFDALYGVFKTDKEKGDYEQLGHGEVVFMDIPEANFKDFAKIYFDNFVKIFSKYARKDVFDKGPGYRHLVGIPGGMKSSLF